MREKSKVLAFEKFREKVDSPYRLVLLAAKNAKGIIRDAKTQGKILERKPIDLALRQILNDTDPQHILDNAPDSPEKHDAGDEEEKSTENPDVT